jgi:predicted nucleotidyltransferase
MKDYIIVIIKDLKKLLVKNLGDDIDKVILFGSYAINQNNNYSDIDILIILKSDYDYAYKRKIRDLCYEISLKYDVLIDSKIISIKDLDTPEGKHPIYQDAINQGIYA